MAGQDAGECPLCSEIYKRPRMLPCGHSFCEECLISWQDQCFISNQVMSCPECRNETLFPASGISGLPINFALTKIVVAFANVTVSDGASELMSHNPSKECEQHRGKCIEYFCQECQKDGCHRCMHLEHRQHDIVTIEEYLDGIDHQVHDELGSINEVRTHMKNVRDSWEAADQNQTTNITNIREDIIMDKKQSMKELEQLYGNLLQVIDEEDITYRKKRAFISKELKSNEKALDQKQAAVNSFLLEKNLFEKYKQVKVVKNILQSPLNLADVETPTWVHLIWKSSPKKFKSLAGNLQKEIKSNDSTGFISNTKPSTTAVSDRTASRALPFNLPQGIIGRQNQGNRHSKDCGSFLGEHPDSCSGVGRMEGQDRNPDQDFSKGRIPAIEPQWGQSIPQLSAEQYHAKALAAASNIVGTGGSQNQSPDNSGNHDTPCEQEQRQATPCKDLTEEEIEKKTKTIMDEFLHKMDYKGPGMGGGRNHSKQKKGWPEP